MTVFLYFCIILSFFNLFLIIYTWTLPLYPETLRKKWNQDSLVGVANLFLNLIVAFSWIIYFYFYLFASGSGYRVINNIPLDLAI